MSEIDANTFQGMPHKEALRMIEQLPDSPLKRYFYEWYHMNRGTVSDDMLMPILFIIIEMLTHEY